MTELDIIKSLKKDFSKASLNEADTRYKIIDTILKDVLKWPLKSTFCEVIFGTNRADYILYGKNSKPILILESKKRGSYFELPRNLNQGKNSQTILVEKLLTDENIKKAMLQVKEYCEDFSCNYAGICNGFVWIFFCVSSAFVPWKKQQAFVIKNLNYFEENLSSAINLLGYINLIENNSLKENIGASKKISSEIFYPKSSITAYDMPVSSNPYASIFNSIARKYLGNIPWDDKIFFENCYVTNKGHYDDLQKNVQGVVYDSITPFFKTEGVKGFYDDRKGGSFTQKIEEVLRKDNLDTVMILFGGRGSGKSTFLKRLLFHLRPPEIERHSVISLVDLIYSPQDPDELAKEIWNKVLQEIDKDNLLQQDKKNLIKLFSDKFANYEKQVLQGFDETSIEYQKLLNDFILETLNDKKYCCQVISRHWKGKKKGLIIVLDNLDQLRPELQDVCFLTSIEISKKLSCLTIISMREERYFNAKIRGALDAYLLPGFHITSPVIPDVIGKRITFTLDQMRKYREIRIGFGINNQQTEETVSSFLRICLNEVNRANSDLSKFLRFSTHGDVRQALDFFKGFITSGYTNINEMAPHPTWRFQIHQVIKPMMIPDRFFYDEKISRMPNVFQLRNDMNSSHFTGLRILNLLNLRSYDRPSAGFIDAKYVVQKFENDFDLKTDCEKNLDILLEKGIIESSNRLEKYSPEIDQIRLTSFGKYILEYLAFDFTYLDLVSLDCGLFDEELATFFIRSADNEINQYLNRNLYERVLSRIARVERFIAYLKLQEQNEFNEFNIPASEAKYCQKIEEKFNSQKAAILKSAKENTNK